MKKPTRGDWIRAHASHKSGVECLIWPFAYFPNGYANLGIIGDGSSRQKRINYAHRYMCEVAHGPAPEGHEAAHSCGNRGCVNPNHLSWKTTAGNQADRKLHGTDRRPGKKLTPDQRSEIRALKGVMTQRELAALYGVTFQNISILHRAPRGAR